MDYNLLINDAALRQYLLSLIVNLTGTVMFGWWWWKHKNASFVFMCVTLLFAGKVVERGVQVYARSLRLATCSVVWTDDSWIWAYKGTLSMVVSLVVVIWGAGRILGYFGQKESGDRRRRSDI